MAKRPEPNRLPISQLPLITHMVTGMLKDTKEQHRTFLAVVDKPHVLDDATVKRAERVFQTQLDDLWLYEQQCDRWLKETLSPEQRSLVVNVQAQVEEIRSLTEALLAMVEKIKPGTIDQIMKKSDLELGLDALKRQRKQKPDEDE